MRLLYLSTMRELDSIGREFSDLPKPPSEYIRSNVFLGASFISTDQVEEACREGYAENVLWGQDYPHVEGVFQVQDDPDAEPIPRLALRHAFSRTDGFKIFDVDAHVVEPRNLWERFLDERYQDRVLWRRPAGHRPVPGR